MELNLEVLVLTLLIVIATTCLAVVGMLFYFLKSLRAENLPEVVNESGQKVEGPEGTSCAYHPKAIAMATCSICQRPICQKCFREADDVHFCSEHLRTYLDNEWEVLSQVRSSVQEPEDGLLVYEFKTSLWNSDMTPTFLVTHYQIDVHGDHIETHTKLFVREQDLEELSQAYHTYKKTSQ